MSDITLFENNALANSDLFKELQDVNNKPAVSALTVKRSARLLTAKKSL